ncbi:hypothetical protein IKH83_00070 [Candidatus Saccharibacteria bacterium]|nr:hypothetical protein [Candidatus Saccharibacteria bacterium]
MKIYISGISGKGMGPLALLASDAGFEVIGSDLAADGDIMPELMKRGIKVNVGPQDGNFLRSFDDIDWFVHTSALKADNPELIAAKELGIRVSKRDELIAFLIEKLGLKMVAVAGTHGKTTTTAILIYAFSRLGIPAAHIVGSTLSFAPAGKYTAGDEYFIYEADEFDRNFLHFHPFISLIPSETYDHADIYPTREDYHAAFEQFRAQSQQVIEGGETDSRITLVGESRRFDATLAKRAIMELKPELDELEVIKVINDFPGVARRFEKIATNVYSDYAHHPEEVETVINIANEEAERLGLKGVVVAYQPLQNMRQHEVRHEYKKTFLGASKLFWLPTFLTREKPGFELLTPEMLIGEIENPEIAEPADLNDALAEKLLAYKKDGYLILMILTGETDEWARVNLKD